MLFPITIVVANPVENEKAPDELRGIDSVEGRTGFNPDSSNNPSKLFVQKKRSSQLIINKGLKVIVTRRLLNFL